MHPFNSQNRTIINRMSEEESGSASPQMILAEAAECVITSCDKQLEISLTDAGEDWPVASDDTAFGSHLAFTSDQGGWDFAIVARSFHI